MNKKKLITITILICMFLYGVYGIYYHQTNIKKYPYYAITFIPIAISMIKIFHKKTMLIFLFLVLSLLYLYYGAMSLPKQMHGGIYLILFFIENSFLIMISIVKTLDSWYSNLGK